MTVSPFLNSEMAPVLYFCAKHTMLVQETNGLECPQMRDIDEFTELSVEGHRDVGI